MGWHGDTSIKSVQVECLINTVTVNLGDACGVMVIVVGNGHGDTSSNPGRDWLHFTLH